MRIAHVTLMLAASVVVGCGSSSTSDDRLTQGSAAERGSTAESSTTSSADVTTSDSGGQANDVLDGRQARTLPNGAVIYPAPAATRRRTVASNRCARSVVRTPDGRKQRWMVPPAPGLRARWIGAREVEVVVAAGRPPEACRADYINVLVDNSDDARPPVSRTVRLGQEASVRVVVPLFRQMASADTARATAGKRRGPTGPTAEVAILARR